MIFLGYVPYEELPRHLGMIDVCLSTQSNDLVGQVRTTGKLPIYLAAGRCVLASKVGEAELVLDPQMLVDYKGVKDHSYPRKLKEKIEVILNHPEMLECSSQTIAIARENFEYAILAERMRRVIEATRKGLVGRSAG
jgi:glycosyltransferase involved in cell wall biosynthesis